MGLPPQAIFETDLGGGVALWDVSALLPTGPGDYRNRSVLGISRLYIHKSGGDGPPGFRGCLGMARYCTNPKPSGRGWAGSPYTFWGSRDPDVDRAGRLVIYRCQPDKIRSYHTGRLANDHGVAYAVQGAYDAQWDLLSSGRPKIDVEPSTAQMRCLEAFLPWAQSRYNLQSSTGLSGHWEAARWGGKTKLVCPGDALRWWIYSKRKVTGAVVDPTRDYKPAPPWNPGSGEFDTRTPSVADLQRALGLLGHPPGIIDGIWGYKSRHALELFQLQAGIESDGWYGPETANALLKALRDRGLSRRDMLKGKVP